MGENGERDYWELLALAAELQGYAGYLDTEDLKQKRKLEERFAAARNKFVYAILRDGGTADEAVASVSADLDQIETESDSSWEPSIAFLRENLLTRIEKESRKAPWLRTTLRWFPVGLGVAAAIAYFSIRFFSGIEVDQPIESREGLQQRAAAAQKVIRYNDWMSGRSRRGGWAKGILLWPIEPSEIEVQAATEFVSVTLDGHRALTEQGQACGNLIPGTQNTLSEQEVRLVGDVATYLRAENVQWRQPPIMTVLDPIRQAFPCR